MPLGPFEALWGPSGPFGALRPLPPEASKSPAPLTGPRGQARAGEARGQTRRGQERPGEARGEARGNVD